jgi:hypothetical protein
MGCCISNCVWKKEQVAKSEAKAKLIQTKSGQMEYSIKG